MNLEQLLKEYIDIGVDDEEVRHIALASLADRIRGLKLQIAQAINEARACLLLDNLSGSNQALKMAASLKKQYHYFYSEWRRLGGDVSPNGPFDSAQDRPSEDGLSQPQGLPSSLEVGNDD